VASTAWDLAAADADPENGVEIGEAHIQTIARSPLAPSQALGRSLARSRPVRAWSMARCSGRCTGGSANLM
jgi:hypothetical protein